MLKERKCYRHKNPLLLECVDVYNILIPGMFILEKKINILLVTWMVITKLTHSV